jgi:hypothetical protein
VSRRAQENLVALTMLVFFAGIFAMSFEYGPRARLVPLPIAALGIVLVLLQLAWQNFRSLGELEVDMLELVSGADTGKRASLPIDPDLSRGDEDSSGGTRRELGAFGLVGSLLALCLVFGPLPAVFAFMAAYFAKSRLCSWLMAIVFALAGTLALYLLFGAVLGVQFNRGLLAPVLSPYLHF